MKKRNYILAGALVAAMGLSSCSDYLNVDRYFNDMQSLEHIFEKKQTTLEWLSYCYGCLQGDNVEIGHSEICPTNFSDDQTFNEGDNGNRYRKFKLGEYGYGYDYGDYYRDSWGWSYQAIRQASILLLNVDVNQEMTQEEITDLKGQARFLRAYFYWLLIKKYGPVPLMPIEGADYTKTYDELSYPRNTFDECVDFIADELKVAAGELAEKRDNMNIARPTRISALAARAKVLLYAASPLYNGNTEMADFANRDGRILIAQEYDEEKWAKAAAAARDVIEYAESTGRYHLYTANRRISSNDLAYPTTITPPECEPYSSSRFPAGWADIDPFESYRSIFNGEVRAYENPELLFTKGQEIKKEDMTSDGGIKSLVKFQLPVSCGGWNSHGVTQKQCDAYDMADGTPYDRDAVLAKYEGNEYVTPENKDLHPYDHLQNGVWMGYANREPRFYASVAFNGAVWPCTSAKEESYRYRQIWYYRASKTGDGRSNGSQNWNNTGIGVMKYVHPGDCNVSSGSISAKMEPTIRYADVLLMYAEALNNLTRAYTLTSWDGLRQYTVERDKEEMRRGVKPVRMRAGVPDYPETVYDDPQQFFDRLVHERQLEFFNENQRFYDLRRWKIAEEHEAEAIYGCNTLMTEDYRDEYHAPCRVAKLQTSFSRKQYFWPIYYTELQRNKNLVQAPGWQDYD